MAITPNYSWPLPDDTSLVKDGAEAIRDLGNAIDNTVENLPSGALVHINTVTIGSGVSSVSVNDCFSATHDEYLVRSRIILSTSANLSLRFRVSGADNTNANYNTQRIRFASTAVTASRTDNQTISNFTINALPDWSWDMQVSRAFQTDNSFFKGVNTRGLENNYFGTSFNDTTSFDGFSFITSTGTFLSGYISVYGLVKA